MFDSSKSYINIQVYCWFWKQINERSRHVENNYAARTAQSVREIEARRRPCALRARAMEPAKEISQGMLQHKFYIHKAIMFLFVTAPGKHFRSS